MMVYSSPDLVHWSAVSLEPLTLAVSPCSPKQFFALGPEKFCRRLAWDAPCDGLEPEEYEVAWAKSPDFSAARFTRTPEKSVDFTTLPGCTPGALLWVKVRVAPDGDWSEVVSFRVQP